MECWCVWEKLFFAVCILEVVLHTVGCFCKSYPLPPHGNLVVCQHKWIIKNIRRFVIQNVPYCSQGYSARCLLARFFFIWDFQQILWFNSTPSNLYSYTLFNINTIISTTGYPKCKTLSNPTRRGSEVWEMIHSVNVFSKNSQRHFAGEGKLLHVK